MDVVVIATLFCVQAASMALHHFPILNSSVDETCENITFKVCYIIILHCLINFLGTNDNLYSPILMVVVYVCPCVLEFALI